MKNTEIYKSQFIQTYLLESKITQFTDIQARVIPEILKGKSVNVIAKTGSGKTLTFLLPIIDLIKNYELNQGPRVQNADRGKPMAVILTPTRELAMQIAKVTKGVAHHAKLRVRTQLGGTGTKTKEMGHEFVDILIATPGRLASSIKRSEINMSDLRYLIMDEADQLLELGFKKDLETIYGAGDATLVKIGLFSATYSDALKSFVESVFHDVEFFDYNIQDKNQLSRSVRTFNIYLRDTEKYKMTEAFIKNEAKGRGIIFVNKHETADTLVEQLKAANPKNLYFSLHGEMKAPDRKKAYDQYLKQGGILVTTDIMARGIDIKDLNWVLNYDLPFEAVYYIHRCGRVGRNSKDGFVYNLVCPIDSAIVSRINEAIKNQTALVLSSFDENKFKTDKKIKEKRAEDSKLTKKKKVLAGLRAKVDKGNRPGAKGPKRSPLKKHVKTVKRDTTPRYKRAKTKKK